MTAVGWAYSGACSSRLRGTRLLEKESRLTDPCPPGSVSFVLSETFKVTGVCTQIFRRPAYTANQSCLFRQFIGRTRDASSDQISLERDPHQIRRRIPRVLGTRTVIRCEAIYCQTV